MAHMSFEQILKKTDEELEAFDREESRNFRRSWERHLASIAFASSVLILVGILCIA